MNFKLAIAAFFTFIFSAFKLFSFIGKAKANEIKAEAEAEAREYEKAGSDALIGGLQREHKEVDKPIDVKNRTDFE